MLGLVLLPRSFALPWKSGYLSWFFYLIKNNFFNFCLASLCSLGTHCSDDNCAQPRHYTGFCYCLLNLLKLCSNMWKCPEVAANCINGSFAESMCDWNKTPWNWSSSQLLLSEAVYRVRRSQLLTLDIIFICPWTGAGAGIAACYKAGRWFLGSARRVLMLNLILFYPWEGLSAPECRHNLKDIWALLWNMFGWF